MNFSQHKTHPVWLLGHCSIRRQKAICSFDRQCSDTDIKCSILVLHNSIRIWYNNLHNIRAHCTNTAIQFCNISGRHPTNQLQPAHGFRRAEMAWMLTGQFADKPTRGQSNRGLANLRTGQLANCNFFNHDKTTLYLYTKPNPNPKSIDYWNCLIEQSTTNYIYSNYLLQIINQTFRWVE